MKAFLEHVVGPAYAKCFARPSFYPLNKAIFHLGLRGMGLLNCTSGTSGERHFIKNVLPNYLGQSDKPVLFDVGANVGRYTAFLNKCFPHASIYSFEPHPQNFKALQTTAGSYAQCHNFGMGSANETITLFDRADKSQGSSHASLYEQNITTYHQQESVEHKVEIHTLDETISELGLTHIDFLKIDTEGHELKVLEGGRKAIESNLIKVIQFEFGSTQCFSKSFIYDFKAALPNHKLYRLLPSGLLDLSLPLVETEIFGFQNVAALPNDRVG